MPTLHDQVVHEVVSAECCFNAVSRSVTPIVTVKQVIVAASLSGIHCCLASPKEEAVAAVSHRVVGENVLVGLLVNQDAR